MVSAGGRQKTFERAQRKGRATNVQSLQDGLWVSGCTAGWYDHWRPPDWIEEVRLPGKKVCGTGKIVDRESISEFQRIRKVTGEMGVAHQKGWVNEASGSFRGSVAWETPDHGRHVLPCPGSHGPWPLLEEKDPGSRLSILFGSVGRHRAHALRLSPFSENQDRVGACAREASGHEGSPKVAMVQSCGSSPCKRPA